MSFGSHKLNTALVLPEPEPTMLDHAGGAPRRNDALFRVHMEQQVVHMSHLEIGGPCSCGLQPSHRSTPQRNKIRS